MKKIFAIMLALVLVLAMGASAMAATITITNAVDGQTYTAYKIFNVTHSGSAYSYSVVSEWATAVRAYDQTDDSMTVDAAGNVIFNDAKNWTGGTGFAAYMIANKPSGLKGTSADAANGTAVISGLDAGFYLVDSSLGALCMLVSAADAGTIQEKNEEPLIDKVVTEDTVDLTDTLHYTITVTASGSADTTYVVHDTLTGATLNEGSFVIKKGDTAVDSENYSIVYDPTDGCTFEITFNEDYTKTLGKGETIVITYTATPDAATIAWDEAGHVGSIVNQCYLQYGENSTVEVETLTDTFAFDINKVVSGSTTVLDGAQFTLTKGDKTYYFTVAGNVYTECASTANGATSTITAGAVKIKGIEEGTYSLTEIQAPAGYNKLTSPVSVEIGLDDDGEFYIKVNGVTRNDVTIENSTGSELPSTGGIGTTIFYVIGGLLMAAAVVLLVTKKKVSSK